MSSTIGRMIETNSIYYYHLIFIELHIFMLYLYKNFIILDFIHLLFLILSRYKLNLFIINLNY